MYSSYMTLVNPIHKNLKRKLPESKITKSVNYSKTMKTKVLTLPNGLQVVLHSVPIIGMVSVYLQVNTGSNYEGKFFGSGISHFLEHCMFLGSKKFPEKDQFSNVIQSYGGIDLNAYTGETSTCYQFSVLSQYLQKSLEALYDFIFYPRLQKKDINEERGTIFSEMDLYDDKSADWFYRLIFSRTFWGEPNELPIIGLRKLFNQITDKNLREYHQNCYRPENLSLFIVGKFNISSIEKYLNKKIGIGPSWLSRNDAIQTNRSFYPGGQKGYWTSSSPEVRKNSDSKIFQKKSTKELKGVVKITETCHHRAEFIRINLCWEGCDFYHLDNYVLDILSHILASGRGSILYDTLKEKQGLVEKISAFSLQTQPYSTGRFFIDLTLSQSHTHNRKNIAQVVDKVYKKITIILNQIDKYLTEDMLVGSKNTFLKAFIDEKEDFIDIASTLSHSLSHFGHLNFESEYFYYINHLKRKEISRIVKQYLQKKSPQIFLLLPEKVFRTGKIFPSLDTERVDSKKMKSFENKLEKRIDSYIWKKVNPVLGKKLSPATILSSNKVTPTFRKELSNGVTLLYKKITGLPKTSLQMIFQGGCIWEAEEKIKDSKKNLPPPYSYPNGNFNLLSQLFFSSNYAHSKKEIAEMLRHNGVIYSSYSGENTFGMGFSFLKDRLPSLLTCLEPILLNTRYKNSDFIKEKKNILFALKKSKEDSFYVALQNFKKHFFGKTIYSLDPKGNEKIIPHITLKDVIDIKKKFIIGNNLVAHLTGDFTESQLNLLHKSLRKLPIVNCESTHMDIGEIYQQNQPSKNIHFPQLKYQKNSMIIDYDPGGQAHFLMGYRAPALGDPKSDALKLISHYLEGIGGPLFKLRSIDFVKNGQSLGGRCYRLGCFMKTAKHYGMIVFYASFSQEAVYEHLWALESFQKELEHIRQNLIDDHEIERAKTSLFAEMKTQSIKYNQISFREGLLETYGLGYDHGKKEMSQLQSLTATNLREAANYYLGKNNFLVYAMKPHPNLKK